METAPALVRGSQGWRLLTRRMARGRAKLVVEADGKASSPIDLSMTGSCDGGATGEVAFLFYF